MENALNIHMKRKCEPGTFYPDRLWSLRQRLLERTLRSQAPRSSAETAVSLSRARVGGRQWRDATILTFQSSCWSQRWYYLSENTLCIMWDKKKVAQSCPTLRPHRLCSPWNFPGQNTGVGSPSLLQGLNPGLQHCGWILYQLSHGCPRALEWVAYPFSSGSSRPRNGTRVCCTAGGFFTNWAIREAQCINK